MSEVKMKDHSGEVKKMVGAQINVALEALGLAAEGFAKANLTRAGRVDTDRLRGSIDHQRDGSTEYIGTNVPYAIYNELGTGPLAEGGKGRQNVPWYYKDEKGKWHACYGMKPTHFLKNAITEHVDEYQKMIIAYMGKLK